jgi:hypothetical protein
MLRGLFGDGEEKELNEEVRKKQLTKEVHK